MSKIAIIGHFGGTNDFSDGQTVKTKELYNHIVCEYISEVFVLDTYQITKNIFKLVGLINDILRNNEKVVLVVSSRGYKVLLPILILLNQIYKRDIYDFVIGGYRQNHLKKNIILRWFSRQCKMIYLESHSLVNDYKSLKISNCMYLPNFKKLNVVSDRDLNRKIEKPFKLCTFSRIRKEKGIEDAIEVVKLVNTKLGEVVFELDIFGVADKGYKERFKDLQTKFPSYIRYGGLIDYSNSTDVLKDYFLLLFPTYHNGEGFPGTLIDAFASGLPVIASDWNCNAEIIEDGKTGRIVPVKDISTLSELLLYYVDHPSEVLSLRKNCVDEAYKYTPEYALKPFIDDLKGQEKGGYQE
ncbi:glycosyltransferase involved in cell wall biosynthesis [Peribacillus deserti]|uniref:Glycosyltransferase involved in cell wall biosynthesis n=1 Tax=Peribacillus deserti TaxID=673318 RepID=A0ABS2QD87_9BACI|nr:glycosyltransferase family 4 protein [Peribacillus deserti]MBM7690779.1 glycosyltransferase involved in cell wall biosynthesis [Peribacillus deserti]